MTEIQFRHLFTIKAEVDMPPQLIGSVPMGYTRRIMPVSGGYFKGSRLSGDVLPGGADCVIERPDGGLHLDVRLALKTDRNELIYMTYFGRRNGPPGIMEKIVKREDIPRGADYFRVAVEFETSAPRLLWLNDIIAVGSGYREHNGPVYDIQEIL